MAETTPSLRSLAPDLWVADRPFKLPLRLGDIGCRMTVIRLTDGTLFLHSPVPLDSCLRAELSDLGLVRAVVAPSKLHHLFVADYVSAYPEAKLYGAPGLSEKRKDLAFDSILSDESPADWQDQIDQLLFRGAPVLNEVLFFHRATRTVMFTDLVFNIAARDAPKMRIFNWLTGIVGHFGPHRLVRLCAFTDREAARESIRRVLGWDFDRVIVTHGEVVESGGRDRVGFAFSFL
jgi:hypothetical protein